MDDLRLMARAAKQRLKTNFWDECKKNISVSAELAKEQGLNENKVKSRLSDKVKSEIKGEKQDEFYLRVKEMLDSEGEVSDALGRLTDREYYATLSYEEQQRYNLQLSNKYLQALERYRRENN